MYLLHYRETPIAFYLKGKSKKLLCAVATSCEALCSTGLKKTYPACILCMCINMQSVFVIYQPHSSNYF